MEDVKIWRNMRRRLINRALTINGIPSQLVPANPDRIALHIYSLSQLGQDVRVWDGLPIASASLVAAFWPGGTVAPLVNVFDGVTVTPYQDTFPGPPWIMHIRDYGQAITQKLFADSVFSEGSYTIWELILDARSADQLKGDGP